MPFGLFLNKPRLTAGKVDPFRIMVLFDSGTVRHRTGTETCSEVELVGLQLEVKNPLGRPND